MNTILKNRKMGEKINDQKRRERGQKREEKSK